MTGVWGGAFLPVAATALLVLTPGVASACDHAGYVFTAAGLGGFAAVGATFVLSAWLGKVLPERVCEALFILPVGTVFAWTALVFATAPILQGLVSTVHDGPWLFLEIAGACVAFGLFLSACALALAGTCWAVAGTYALGTRSFAWYRSLRARPSTVSRIAPPPEGASIAQLHRYAERLAAETRAATARINRLATDRLEATIRKQKEAV